jgi:hypothetical protein
MLAQRRFHERTEDSSMKSPFPGMDPYIEACDLWGDFYQGLLAAIDEALAQSAPERYLIRADKRSYTVLVGAEGDADYPFPPHHRLRTANPAPTKDTEPAVLRAFLEGEHNERFTEIYEATPEHRLVTTIEVLSPPNKRVGGHGRDLYLRKRQSLMMEGVNLVEIDLLRGGERMPMLDPWPASPYTLMVAQAKKPYACLVWQGHFQKPLPTIRVPLLKPDADLPLDLQPLIDTLYQRRRYAESIDYARPLKPPLSAEEAAWLKRQLRTRQKKA